MTEPTEYKPSGLRIARIAGISIYIGWGAMLLSGLLAFLLMQSWSHAFSKYERWEVLVAVLSAVIFFLFSILFHEMAHSLLAKRYGIEVSSISLWFLGGVSVFKSGIRSPGVDFWVSFIGPLSSLFLAGVFFGASWAAASLGAGTLILVVLMYMCLTNLALGVFNLIPASPLDGGRVLRSIVWKVSGSKLTGTVVASTAGQILGWLFVLFAVVSILLWSNYGAIWYALIGWFIIGAASAEKSAAKAGYLDEV